MEGLPQRRPSVSLLILDSSATLAWIYGDEVTEAIRRVFDAIADNGALVPALWRLEVANSLTLAVRRRRVDPDFRRTALADLTLLDITTDQQIDSYAWTDTLNLRIASSLRSTPPLSLSLPSEEGCHSLHSTRTWKMLPSQSV